MNTELIDNVLSQIIQEAVGINLTEDTILALMHIIHAYELYLSEESPLGDEDANWPIEYTQRATAQLAALVYNASEHKNTNYLGWIQKYSDGFGDWYSVPANYRSLVSNLVDKLRKHPWVKQIDRGLAAEQ